MQENTPFENHSLSLENRELLTLSGVLDVTGFDEETVNLKTPAGTLIVKGNTLHINHLSLDTGQVSIDGRINSLQYLGDTRQKGIVSKLFR